MTFTNVVFDANQSVYGGALDVASGSTLRMQNATVSNNVATADGEIFMDSARLLAMLGTANTPIVRNIYTISKHFLNICRVCLWREIRLWHLGR